MGLQAKAFRLSGLSFFTYSRVTYNWNRNTDLHPSPHLQGGYCHRQKCPGTRSALLSPPNLARSHLAKEQAISFYEPANLLPPQPSSLLVG